MQTETKPEIKIVYIYSSYTPNVKECIYRYRNKEGNKEKIKLLNKASYLKRMENPEYRERMNKESQARYRKKKDKLIASKLEASLEGI